MLRGCNTQIVMEALSVNEVTRGEERSKDRALNDSNQWWIEKEKLPQEERTVCMYTPGS